MMEMENENRTELTGHIVTGAGSDMCELTNQGRLVIQVGGASNRQSKNYINIFFYL